MVPAPPPPLAAGTRAPALRIKTISGKSLSLHSLRGRVVLIDFWATWCIPCRMDAPTLEKLQREYGRHGLTVIGISMDDRSTISHIKPFIRKYHVTYAIAASPATDQWAARAYREDGLPSQYLIDQRGIVRWSQAGFSFDEGSTLSRFIRRLLAQKK
jgi:thiol-disulfide isomerase/thioredoxin